MIQHIVAWNFQPHLTDEDKTAAFERISAELDQLFDLMANDFLEFELNGNTTSDSQRELILHSLFRDQAALDAYQVHPDHQRLGAYIRTVLQDRVCLDYHIDDVSED